MGRRAAKLDKGAALARSCQILDRARENRCARSAGAAAAASDRLRGGFATGQQEVAAVLRLALVNMPFADWYRPSFALSQLAALVRREFREAVAVDVHYPNVELARTMGVSIYDVVASQVDHAAQSGIGDWIFRRIAFPDAPDNTEEYFHRFYRGSRWNAPRERLLDLRERLPGWCTDLIDHLDLATADVVGFTSMFTQQVPSFALARLIKERNPNAVVVIGGANCEAPMGAVVAKHVPAVDFVFSGPASRTLPQFLDCFVDGRPQDADRIPGIVSRRNCDDPCFSSAIGEELDVDEWVPAEYSAFQEILGTLCGGGTVAVVPESLRRDPFELLVWLTEQRIERLFLPYLALHMLSVAASTEESLDHLRLVEVNTAGEQVVCTPPIRELFARLPRCRLNNHYGQSESAMVTSHTLDGPSGTWPPLPPIGAPLPGCEPLIDPRDPAEPTVGELLVAGLPVSLGYLNQPALNAERFIAVEATPQGHTRAFRTGDLVRLDQDLVHFLSRIDHDVKVRGVRVNLLEVDAWLLDQPGIVEAACVLVEAGEGARTLRAAVILEDGQTLDREELLTRLADVLPAVSVPASITALSELPRTPSGKIDRTEVARRISEARDIHGSARRQVP
jgi:hypothetical protein